MNLKIILKGQPITKKNSQQIIVTAGRPRVAPSVQYRRYENISLLQIPPKAKQNIETPVNVQCVYYMKTRRAVDLTNLLEATDDILVKGGVLKDDNCRIIATHDGSRVDYDKENPRVEITITPYHGIVI